MFLRILKYDKSQPRDGDGKWSKISFGGTDEKGKGGSWSNADGSSLSKEDAARVAAARIPPGWHNVELNVDPNAATQVRGRDKNNKQQIRQSTAHTEAAAAEKFARVKEFHKTAVKKILDRVNRDMNNPALSAKERDTAAVTALLGKTGFRIGSTRDTKAQKQAYGASTLMKKHVKVTGDNIDFAFTGKKGVEQSKSIKDPQLAKYIGERLKKIGATDRVFTANDGDTNGYIHKVVGNNDFTNKDFRTWHGTGLALAIRKQSGIPRNNEEAASLRKTIGEKVSKWLGNTPPIALKDYIAPFVFDPWGDSKGIVPKKPKKVKKDDLQSISFEELWDLMDEAMDTYSYTETKDWRKMPELSVVPEDDPSYDDGETPPEGLAHIFSKSFGKKS